MLLNLSSHPFSLWDKLQQDVAVASFGRVEDYPFPIIDPEMDIEGVVDLANKCFNEIMKDYTCDLSIHLMGEYTFCYQILKLFESVGVSCYASTSQRKIIYVKNNIKKTEFEFVKFRAYSI